jgi:hypothetical protein
MCEGAAKAHTESHEVIALKDLAPNSGPLLCSQHSLALSVFCQTCEQLVCLQCSLVSHKGHKCSDVEGEVAARLSLLQTTVGKVLSLKQVLQPSSTTSTALKLNALVSRRVCEEQKAVITTREKQVGEFLYLIINAISFTHAPFSATRK